ncbi:MetQ/NlpA family ABC transporter substrate-binding protein [Halothermothrix orenii]|uniref:NLPA lipoprotein n=1 Tax=Halothermothrix orenii (strain H 168 / OCM 544 / DSM 9562) TaxID=373903 RepID=B8D0N7_HALOH|nr:MetQ/NlpA family ABC transporter substrate-binding protein [Halothermothrix orenii]ACL70973.1 NLPA lipoprotein [Halothermothrix orenii H 168]
MRRNIIFFLVLIFVLGVGSIALAGDKVLKVGATPVPHAEILEFVKPILEKEGIKLEIVEFTDYVTPNLALAEGSIDANYFQHVPYLNQFKKDHNLDITYTLKIHVEPFGLYSEKIDSIDDLPAGARIALPNDPSNEGRALLLLESKGFIKLDAEDKLKATPFDIVENPYNLKFVELEAATLPRILPDVMAAFINTNYALEAGLNPLKDALIIEGSESPYSNVLAVRTEDKDNPLIIKLGEVLTSQKVKDFILEKYKGAVVPVF